MTLFFGPRGRKPLRKVLVVDSAFVPCTLYHVPSLLYCCTIPLLANLSYVHLLLLPCLFARRISTNHQVINSNTNVMAPHATILAVHDHLSLRSIFEPNGFSYWTILADLMPDHPFLPCVPKSESGELSVGSLGSTPLVLWLTRSRWCSPNL